MAAVVALQVGYYLHHVAGPALYRDEANDFFTATANAGSLVQQFLADWDPYVWILALRAWVWFFGGSEAALRGLPFVCMVLATLLFWRMARRVLNDGVAATTAAVLLGLNGAMLRVSIGYARPYAMTLLTSVWMLDRFWAWASKPSLMNYAGLVLAACLFGNIQPVNYGLAAGLVVWSILLAWHHRTDRPSAIRFGLMAPALLGLCALPSLIQSLRFSAADTGFTPVASTPLGIGLFIKIGWKWLATSLPLVPEVLDHLFDDNPAAWGARVLHGHGLWIALPGIGVVVTGLAVWGWHVWRCEGWRKLTPVLLLVLMPLMILGFGSRSMERMVSPMRAFAAFGPGLCLLIVLLVRSNRALLWGLSVIVIARASAALLFLHGNPTAKRSDVREAVAWMDEVRGEDVVLVANPPLGPSFHYYYRGPVAEEVLPYANPVLYWNDIQLWKDVSAPDLEVRARVRVERAASEGRRIWFVSGGVHDSLPVDQWQRFYAPDAYRGIHGGLTAHYRLLREARFETTDEPYRVGLYIPNQD